MYQSIHVDDIFNVSSHSGRLIRGDISGGLTGRQFRAQRHSLAKELLQMVEASGAVLIRGPPQSGKTSLMELVQEEAEGTTEWQHVIRISMATGTSLDSVLMGQANTTWADFWGTPTPSESGESSVTGQSYHTSVTGQSYHMFFPVCHDSLCYILERSLCKLTMNLHRCMFF